MFIIILSYKKNIEEVEKFIVAHRDYLAPYYRSGHFLMSGRKEPRDGGVILATAPGRAEIDAIIQKDPFWIEDVASYEVIEFIPTTTAPELSAFRVSS